MERIKISGGYLLNLETFLCNVGVKKLNVYNPHYGTNDPP
jgi:hypothetical protein